MIDGQQRLITGSLIIAALAQKLSDSAEPVPSFSTQKLRNYYLLNPQEEGERRYKLLLTKTDKQTLLSLLDDKDLPQQHSLRLERNFDFFKKKIAALGNNLEELCKGLVKLMVMDIALSCDHGNPQLIFESMNSTARELSQADLIRNFILMGHFVRSPGPALQRSLAAYGTRLRTGELWAALRRFHAPLSDAQAPPRSAKFTKHSRHTLAAQRWLTVALTHWWRRLKN